MNKEIKYPKGTKVKVCGDKEVPEKPKTRCRCWLAVGWCHCAYPESEQGLKTN